MLKKISVVGGDLRIVKLVEMLVNDGYEVETYALEKAESLNKLSGIKKHANLKEGIQGSEIVIGSIPISSNDFIVNTPFSDTMITMEELANAVEGKTFIAGSIKPEFYQLLENKQVEVIDILNREELAVLNTISTAEGAIQIAMEETPRTIHGSDVLVLGFGRVGKILARMLQGIGANVYCEARKNEDLAWIRAYGYNAISLNELKENLSKFDIIMNTIPHVILDKDKLEQVKGDCLIIDLASKPGGVDKEAIKQKEVKLIWALSLPGKVAPLTSAEFIKDTIYNIFKELEK